MTPITHPLESSMKPPLIPKLIVGPISMSYQ